MKKLKQYSILIILFYAFGYNAQQNEVKFTVHDFEVEENYDPKLVDYGKNTDGNYVILKKEPIRGPGGWRYYLETRDSKMEKIEVKEISTKLKTDVFYISQTLFMKDKLIVFSSLMDKTTKSVSFYHQTVDLKTLEVSKRKEYYVMGFEKKRKLPNVVLKSSNDNNYFLIEVQPYYKKDEEESISLYLLDQNLNMIWKQEKVKLGHNDKDYEILQTEVANNGDVFMLGSVLNDEEEELFEIFAIDKKGIRNAEVLIEGKETMGLSIVSAPNNELFLTGYFTKDDTKGVKGAFCKKINKKTLKSEKEATTNFSEELVLYGDSPKVAQKKKKKSKKKATDIGATSLYADHLVFDDEGNFYLIGSQFWIETRTYTTSNGGIRTITIYHYEDIYISKFSKDYKHIYNAKIPKSSTRALGEPYNCIIKGDKLVVVYFDNKKNVFPEYIKEEGVAGGNAWGKCCMLGVSVVDNKGNVSRETLFEFEKEGYKAFTGKNQLSTKNDILFLVYLGKKVFSLGIVK